MTFGHWEGGRIWSVRSLPLCLSFPCDPRGALPVLVGPHLGGAVCGYSCSCTVAVCLFFSSFLVFFFSPENSSPSHSHWQHKFFSVLNRSLNFFFPEPTQKLSPGGGSVTRRTWQPKNHQNPHKIRSSPNQTPPRPQEGTPKIPYSHPAPDGSHGEDPGVTATSLRFGPWRRCTLFPVPQKKWKNRLAVPPGRHAPRTKSCTHLLPSSRYPFSCVCTTSPVFFRTLCPAHPPPRPAPKPHLFLAAN